ncbi:L-fucose mutarotase [Sphaerisporangium rufum]|uniref:L-fucose mutarotase n=1 Tax=Sphaerisporangium rufum TaxID=1381558 RepID=A0A919R2T6_9ACTN|nr:RbsD/FucU family protein [Sphaerisporangium rufum]GII77371.1 L-fucose mutarotase [Sphaerisporangium rufum]
MLRHRLTHPPLLAALAGTGHGSRVLLADGNYACDVNVRPGAPVVHLNLRAGLVRVDDVLELLAEAVPLEAVHSMRPDQGGEPEVLARYRELLGGGPPIQALDRHEFYRQARGADVALAVATGDERLYANLLLTVGHIVP